jgi:hypothetical protein
MANYNIIAKSLWNSEKFRALPDSDAKLLFAYFCNNDHDNSCGCYKIHPGYIMADMEWPEAQVRAAMKHLADAEMIAYDEKEYTLFLPKFFDHNAPSNPKHAIKIFNDTLSIRNEEFRAETLLELSKALKAKGWKLSDDKQEQLDTLLKGYSIPTSHLPYLTSPHYKNKTKDAREDKKLPVPEKKKLGAEELTVDHIADWLNQKRAIGKYLTIDEYELLELFKDYCRSKNPKYADYVAAFRNSFKWENAPKKGNQHENTGSKPTKAERTRAALDQSLRDLGIDPNPGPGESAATHGPDRAILQRPEAVRERAGIAGGHEQDFSDGAERLPARKDQGGVS